MDDQSAENVSADSSKSESSPIPLKEAQQVQSGKKDSTTELPMFDLGEAVNFVSTIRDKALENIQMPQVATQMGYKHPSSTPFYRRCVAARLFGMIGKSGVELSARAKDYLRPDGDRVREASLRDAIMGIQLYADEVNRHLGKRINVQFIGNSFAKSLQISEGCALECAKVFEQSLRFAGFFSNDGLVNLPALDGAAPPTLSTPPVVNGAEPIDDFAQSHTLYLDKTKKRRFSISAPLDVNPTEVKRIQKWLEVTLLIDWNEAKDDF